MPTEAEDLFKHCIPAIRTDLGRCGALSLCESTKPETLDELETIYKSDDDWRVMGGLLMSNFERKAVLNGRKQNSWEDFLVSNMRNVKRHLSPANLTDSERKIRPFLLMEQQSVVNNKFWRFTAGEADGANWTGLAESKSGIPADVRSFNVGEKVWIEYEDGDQVRHWQGVIAESELEGSPAKVRLVLTPANGITFQEDLSNPVTGILRRGNANVGQYESYCETEPSYNTTVQKDYWMEWSRHTFCDDELTREFYALVLAKNPYYKKFFHKEKAKEAAERLEAFWSKLFDNFMFSRPTSPNQTLELYPQLPKENIFLSENGIGWGGGRCIGYKATNVGWLEQWHRCGRIRDLQGATLDMWALIDALYDLKRVRFNTNSPATVRMTAFADRSTAELLDRGFIKLQNVRTDDAFRITQSVNGGPQPANAFGFQFRSYNLPGKGYGITLDVITHDAFDDYISEWSDLNNEDMGRQLWLVDPTNFYAGIVEVDRSENKSGNAQDLARVSDEHMCVQRVVQKEVSIMSVLFTSIVEVAERDLILRGFANTVPAVDGPDDDTPNYLPQQGMGDGIAHDSHLYY